MHCLLLCLSRHTPILAALPPPLAWAQDITATVSAHAVLAPATAANPEPQS